MLNKYADIIFLLNYVSLISNTRLGITGDQTPQILFGVCQRDWKNSTLDIACNTTDVICLYVC